MSESDVDAMVERRAREERDDLDRAHGQHILDVTDYAKDRQEEETRSLLDAIGQAHQAKVEADNQ